MDFTIWAEYFQQYPLAFYLIGFLFSLLVGSFLNVVIFRLPIMLEQEWQNQAELVNAANDKNSVSSSAKKEPFNLIVPRSSCPSCQQLIKAWQNIPVLSYCLLRGRCAHCQTGISLRYPIIEIATALLALVILFHFGVSYTTIGALILTYSLLALSVIDYDRCLLPDFITLPLLWTGLIFNYFGTFTSLDNALWGAIFGYLSLWSVFWLFKLFTGKEGMGYGDFKLLAALGAWLGASYLPLIIILSSLVGAILGSILLKIKGQDNSHPIPFGPYIACAGWISLLWGGDIIDRYLQFAGL